MKEKKEISTMHLIQQKRIGEKIFFIRGHKVMLDRDLAELYGVETKYLNRQVKRNIQRFPQEFMFRLTIAEKKELVTNWHRFKTMKHSSALPYAFTEHGVAMLASILKSKTAIAISITIIKTFVKLREILSNHKELAQRLSELERRMEKKDKQIQVIFEAIRQLMAEPEKPKRRIGFHHD